MEHPQNELWNDDDDNEVAQFVSDRWNIAENQNCWHESWTHVIHLTPEKKIYP
jgi:hypothetical protein